MKSIILQSNRKMPKKEIYNLLAINQNSRKIAVSATISKPN
jgi:hypothetical protein